MFRYQVILSVTRQLCSASRKTSKKCLLTQLNHLNCYQGVKSISVATRILCKQEASALASSNVDHIPVTTEQPQEPTPDESSSKTTSHVVKLRGLPYSATVDDVIKFLGDVERDQIRITSNTEGAAFVYLKDDAGVQKVLQKHRQYLGDRYIEVLPSSEHQAEEYLSNPRSTHKFVVLRGLPYSVTKHDIISFLSSCSLHEKDVWIEKKPNGLLTGKAYVRLDSEEDFNRALEQHKESMGSRYVEVFPSSSQNFGATNRGPRFSVPRETSQFRTFPRGGGRESNHVNTVRMRGVPFKAKVQEVIQFFEPLEPCSVDILRDDWGRPSGEAIVKFFSRDEMLEALKKDHAYLGNRYIELTAELAS